MYFINSKHIRTHTIQSFQRWNPFCYPRRRSASWNRAVSAADWEVGSAVVEPAAAEVKDQYRQFSSKK